MQSNWPGIPNWVFAKVVEPSLSESGQKWSSADSASPGPRPTSQPGELSSSVRTFTSGQVSKPVSPFNFNPSAGKAAIGGGLAAVLQAAGGLFRLLGRGGASTLKKRFGQGKRILKQDVTNVKKGADVLKLGSVSGTYGSQVEKKVAAPRAASLLLNRVTSLLLENLGKIRNRNAMPTAVAALLPPLTNSPEVFLSFPAKNDLEPEKPSLVEQALPRHENLNRIHPADSVIVEPKTGVSFPVHLGATTDDDDSSDQVLTGVGARAKTLIKLKSIMIYAFGLYVQPDQLRAKIGDKYAGLSPEELKDRPDFYDDLLSQGVDMTIRLVVHYKGLKMGMVRSAFESSLKSRLKKIKGWETDNGLDDFCSLMSQDVLIFRGTTIDFRWQPGGALQTEIGGRPIGTIFSHHLCRAFFEMYIGDPPISEPAKRAIGESFAKMLTTSSTS